VQPLRQLGGWSFSVGSSLRAGAAPCEAASCAWRLTAGSSWRRRWPHSAAPASRACSGSRRPRARRPVQRQCAARNPPCNRRGRARASGRNQATGAAERAAEAASSGGGEQRRQWRRQCQAAAAGAAAGQPSHQVDLEHLAQINLWHMAAVDGSLRSRDLTIPDRATGPG
jgi:hypothetical protein